MGMFDYINCKYPLPVPRELLDLNVDWSSKEFQTKDLENYLGNYVISEDGQLLEHIEEKEYIPYTEEERKAKGAKSWDFWKDVVTKNVYDKKIEHHGTINFYTDVSITDEEDAFVDFRAYFIYGKLDKIDFINMQKTKSSSVRMHEWDKKREEEKSKLWFKTKSVLSYLGWKWFWKKVANVSYKISRMFSSIQYFITRYFI